MLSLVEVSKSRGSGAQRYTLRVPRLELRAGQQLALVGPSGSGKSTLLDLLALVSPPDSAERFDLSLSCGTVGIGGLWRQQKQSALAELRSRHFGYVLQSGGLLGYLDVRGNIGLSRRLLGLADDGSVERLAQRLDIADQLGKKPSALSGGQRQRVGCARALAHRPPLVLADEPTAALDPVNAGHVLNLLLEQAREQGACCVVATHDEATARAAGLSVLRIHCQRDADGGVTATLRSDS